MTDRTVEEEGRRWTLEIGGLRYLGWSSVTVSESIEKIVSSFSLTMDGLVLGEVSPKLLKSGLSCVLSLDGTPVITGFVDAPRFGYDGSSDSVTISGRSRCCDAIDSQVIPGTKSIRNRRIEQVAQAIVSPWGLKVTADVDTGPLVKRFTPKRRAKIGAELHRLLEDRGLVITDTTTGDLLITRAGTSTAPEPIERGANVLRGDVSFDSSGLFTEYHARGQTVGTDQSFGAHAAFGKGLAEDPTLVNLAGRKRVMVLNTRGLGTSEKCQRHAEATARTRAGQSAQGVYSVDGWTNARGERWRKNQLVRVVDPYADIDATWLVRDLALTLTSQQGDRATMTVVPPAAYADQGAPESVVTAAQTGGAP